MKYVISNNDDIQLTGSKETPKDWCTAKNNGTGKARDAAQVYQPSGCYKAKPKYIYPCESKGMTDEISVIEMEE
jgi:hypothetical protein